MKSHFCINTNNNKYLYSINDNIITINHPILEYLVKFYDKNKKTTFPTYQEIKDSSIIIYDEETYRYYIQKFFFLKRTGFFDPFNRKEDYNGKINVDDIYSSLANTKQITFEVTERCNLKCIYCGYGRLYSNNQERIRRDLSFDDAKTLIDEILELKESIFSLSLKHVVYFSFYGGEPLLNMKLIKEIVSYIKSKNCRNIEPRFSMTTNGILLKRHVDFFVNNNFNILISLDGNKDNNKLRVGKNGENYFDIIIGNVNYIKENYRDFYETNISFNSVLHSENSVEEIHNFFFENYNKIPTIAELNTNGVSSDCQKQFDDLFMNFNESYKNSKNKKEIEERMEYIHPNILNINNFLYAYTNFAFFTYNNLIFPKRNKNKIPTGTCFPFSKKVFVTATGCILPCEKIGNIEFYGKTNNGKVTINYDGLVNKFNSDVDRIKNKCRICYFADNCLKCIYYTNEGNVCDFFMDKEIFLNYLSNTLMAIENSNTEFKEILKNLEIDL